MSNGFPLGRIKIVRTPAGEVPEEIRKMWIGVEMPCIFYSEKTDTAGLVSGQPIATHAAYTVGQAMAIAALERQNPEAAAWWRANDYPQEGGLFSFRADEVEVLVPVVDREEFLRAGMAALGIRDSH